MVRRIVAFVFTVLAAMTCPAQGKVYPSVAQFLPRAESFVAGKPYIIKATGTGASPSLFPGSPLSTSAKVLRIEAMAVLPLPQGGLGADGAIVMKKLALIACSIHSMQGLEYWSASRGRMRILYEEAYRVESEQNRKVVADPGSVAELPPGDSWHFSAFLKDLTFGANVFSYEVGLTESSLTLTSENLTTMRYLLFPLVGPRGLKTRISVIPCAEGILVHFLSTVEAVEIAAKRVFESAGNKSLAVLGWFAGQASKAGLAAPTKIPVDEAAVPSHGGQ